MCYKQKCKVVSLNLAHPVVNSYLINVKIHGPPRQQLEAMAAEDTRTRTAAAISATEMKNPDPLWIIL